MVRLRGHHLLCLLTFVGEGYTPAFTGNFRLIAARLSAGEEIEIVEGPDDICAPMLDRPEAHCRNNDIRDRDAWALAAIDERLGIALKTGSVLNLDGQRLDALRAAFAAGLIRAACHECEWSGLCTRIARDGFEGTLVQS
ncbi:DUF1284 domain-containing protein [Sinorhizobium fredii]|uniref:DUF1284 domain-containing protein n=1 Tax=Rhizobium fredii TaxID=380 RepID=UPI0004BB044A|nr:DUF1284 domain-containing protein [Sinorhizobium fredii]AWI56278.1 hypothetical protein AB395_0000598 [Sinorhizobium fredii CCBAU 45436]AWM23943.1 Substrate-specific component BioY of biotin ECF transporter [Sinorhizobium fredii CCBAU 25509]MQW96468.1 DUF1284 domain-containing protein [Sinorhizobium fredii]UTY48429.1 DUF1284 domain-containing protein [Sinorhizobium fredii]WOS63607.1 DUF1284 domain-containing protein [Sinorhizobium fredii GR64]